MRLSFVLATVFGLSLPAFGTSEEEPKIGGDWEGTMKVSPQASLQMVFHIKQADDGTFSATFDSPSQGVGGIKVDAVKREKETITLELKAIQGVYRGKIAPDGSKIEGNWEQVGQTFPLTLVPAKPAVATKLDHVWEGALSVNGGIELRLVVNVSKDDEGKLSATMDSPDQGVKGLKVDTITLDKTTMSIRLKLINAEFVGKLNDAGTEAKGEWKQGGGSLPLTLKKVDKVSERKRTQVPTAPFPYRAIEVAFPNSAGGNSLAGTLTVPEGDGPFAVAVLISGSGPQDRDETLLGHKPFLVLADDLTRRGVAVLRFDDRGVGGSTGNHATATSADFATDVEAAVQFLKTRGEINPKKIGLVGHSEGGLIAPMVAAKTPDDIAFVVLLAGPGVPGDAILTEQSALIQRAMGGDPADIEKSVAIAKSMYQIIRSEMDPNQLKTKLAALMQETILTLPEAERKALGDDPSKKIEAEITALQTPWFRYFLSYDPRPTLAKVRCPVLAINGGTDLQVPPKQNLPEIEKALKSGGNDKITIKELPGLNHLFQTSKTGAPSEYGRLEESFSPEALRVIGEWIVAQ